MTSLSQKLKDYKKSKGLSQQEMAQLLQVGYRSYQDIEKTGKVAKADTLERIRTFLQLSTQEVADAISTIPISKEGLQEKYIRALEENNQLLKKGNKELVDQLREIKSSLAEQSLMLQSLAITGKIMKAVTLEALGRIEKRKKDADYSEVWDRKAAEVMGE